MKILIFIFISLLFIVTCKKEKDTTSSPSFIICGDTTDLNKSIYHNLDLILIGRTINFPSIYGDSVQLDIDNDGIMDLQFNSIHYNHNVTINNTSLLKCLRSDVKINGVDIIDTIYSINQIRIADSTARVACNCDSIHLIGAITKISQDQREYIIKTNIKAGSYVQILSEKDTISDILDWHFGNLVLSNSYSASVAFMENKILKINGDFLDYGFWNNKTGYIAIQIIKDNLPHFGWIKLRVDDSYKITIISSKIIK